jgi:hypothetical protein
VAAAAIGCAAEQRHDVVEHSAVPINFCPNVIVQSADGPAPASAMQHHAVAQA